MPSWACTQGLVSAAVCLAKLEVTSEAALFEAIASHSTAHMQSGAISPQVGGWGGEGGVGYRRLG